MSVPKLTVLWEIKRSSLFDYKMLKNSFYLDRIHKKATVEWAMEKVTWTAPKWGSVIFTDENINLDGPGGFSYNCHCLGSIYYHYKVPQIPPSYPDSEEKIFF